MTGADRFAGPDCGVDGCQREVGHIGAHRRVEEITPRSLDRAAFGLPPGARWRRVSAPPIDLDLLVDAIEAACRRYGWELNVGEGPLAEAIVKEYDRLGQEL